MRQEFSYHNPPTKYQERVLRAVQDSYDRTYFQAGFPPSKVFLSPIAVSLFKGYDTLLGMEITVDWDLAGETVYCTCSDEKAS